MDAIQFLRDNKIINNDKTKLIITFEDGRQLDLVELFKQFGDARYTDGWYKKGDKRENRSIDAG